MSALKEASFTRFGRAGERLALLDAEARLLAVEADVLTAPPGVGPVCY